MKCIPFLGFSGQAREAMAFHARALGGQFTSAMECRDMPPMEGSGEGGEGCGGMGPETLYQLAHSQREVGPAILMAADGPDAGAGGTTINSEVDSIDEAERVFVALADGGKVVMPMADTFWAQRWGMLTDRYGKPWMVNCMKHS